MKQPAYGCKCYMLPDSFQIGFAVTPPKEPKSETSCWRHDFNDFICVLLLIPLIEWTSIETCFGKNCKLDLFLCLKNLVSCSNFKLSVRGWVEDTRFKAKVPKKIRGQSQGQTLLRPRPESLEANDGNPRGQGPRTQAQVFSKKKVFKIIFQAIFKS